VLCQLEILYFPFFFGTSSVFHFDSWASRDSFRGKANRRDRPFCYLFSSRQGLHDLFDLKMLRAYVQIHRIKLFIRARTKDVLFCYKILLTRKIEKGEGGLTLLNYFYAQT